MKINAIYVVHAKQGYESHEQYVNKLFYKHGLSFEFVSEEDDPSPFVTGGVIEQFFCKDILSTYKRGVVLCTLSHMICYQKMIARNENYGLIFEDDPYFIGNFPRKLEKILPEIEKLKKGFIVSLENTTLKFPHRSRLKKGVHLYGAPFGRCAGAYIVDLEAAKRMMASLQEDKCCEEIDWWHNTMAKKNIIKIYWAHPALTEQASHNGMMHAGISSREKNLFRRLSWKLQKAYKMYLHHWFAKYKGY